MPQPVTSVTGLAMTVFLQVVRWAGRCGERTERCRWQKQRSERVAAVKILSVRRKAAQKFWAPQQDHRPLRRVTGGAMGGRPQGSPLRKSYKGCGKTGRCGERTERCRWQKQRSERVAAVKILSVRRKAAQKFWAPQQDHRPLRRAARNVWAGYRPRRKFFDREGMVCFGFWWRRMTRAPGC